MLKAKIFENLKKFNDKKFESFNENKTQKE
jgi:hypothetical protein